MHPNNYINKLRLQADEQAAEIQALKDQMAEVLELVADFREHLTTPKFHQDTTIQIMDVENRLLTIQNGLITS